MKTAVRDFTEVSGENNIVVLMYHVLVIGINGLRNLTVTFLKRDAEHLQVGCAITA